MGNFLRSDLFIASKVDDVAGSNFEI
jgi:hypothetical protein